MIISRAQEPAHNALPLMQNYLSTVLTETLNITSLAVALQMQQEEK
jgi:hypothetical protein